MSCAGCTRNRRPGLSAQLRTGAGTRNHRIELLKRAVAPALQNNRHLGLWVPGQARDDSEYVARLASHTSAFSRHDLSELCVSFRPLETEGAGNAGYMLHPRSRAQW